MIRETEVKVLKYAQSKRLFGWLVVLLVVTSCVLYSNQLREFRSFLQSQTKGKKIILFWNPFFQRKDYYFGFGEKPFLQCPVSACYTTADRSLVPPDEVDALVWTHSSSDLTFPKTRYKNIRYVFFHKETNALKPYAMSRYDGVFNYTMTYVTDTDFPVPYGAFEPKTPSGSATKNFAAGKTKFAAWFVSHCHTHSKREILAKHLSEYFAIDVFGGCGTMKCSRSDEKECFRLLEKEYKFYLSFENALCPDYVTEKLFKVAQYNVLPVVYGLANYGQVTPPKSVINVMDFKTIKDLADYLIYLNGNDTAYNEYFQWKDSYTVELGKAQIAKGFCNLCARLHEDNSTKVYDNLGEFYAKDHPCLNGTTFLQKFLMQS